MVQRNIGIKGPKQTYSSFGFSGVLDIHDHYVNIKQIPTAATISLMLSGSSGWDGANWTWGREIEFSFTGTNLAGANSTLYYTANTVSGTQPAAGNLDDGTWSGSFSSSSSTSAVLSKRLKLQTSPKPTYTFQWQIRTGSTSGPIIFTSQNITISAYTMTLTTGQSSYNEGDTVYATFAWGGVSAGTNLARRLYNNWTTGEFVTDNEPTSYSNNFSTTLNMGTVRQDLVNENNETFTIGVRSYGSADIGYQYLSLSNTGSGYNQFTVVDTSYYHSSSVSDTTPDEGDTITISLEAYGSANETITWEVYNTSTSNADFSSTTGTFNLSGGTNSDGRHEGSFTLVIERDFITEGSEVFYIIFKNSNGATIGQTSNITIGDTTTLGSVSQTATSINEGDSVTFTINVNGAVSGVNYTYYWKTVGLTSASGQHQTTDFSDNTTTGTFTINGTTGQGTVTRTMANDTYTEGTETWKLQIGPTVGGPWSDAGSTVTVADTSTGTAEPQLGLGPDVASILNAVSSYNWDTNYATIISAIQGAGRGNYKVIATPRASAMAEQMSGVNGNAAMSTSGTGHFDYAAWNSTTNYLELTDGFSNSTLDGYPYMGFVMFNSSGPYGVAIMIFRDYTSNTTLLKNLWYPNQDRELYTYVLNSDGSTVIDTSGNTSTIFSDGQSPGTNGYNNTGRFASDDGSWGFVNGTTRLDGNGGPYHSNSSSNAYGPPANQNSGDSVTNHYWGAAYNTSTNTDTAPRGGAYFFTRYS